MILSPSLQKYGYSQDLVKKILYTSGFNQKNLDAPHHEQQRTTTYVAAAVCSTQAS